LAQVAAQASAAAMVLQRCMLSPQVVVAILVWRVASAGPDRACFGFEETWDICEKPACKACLPIDCQFGAWNAWSYMGGCTELCHRTRPIATPNNECGGGCNGTDRQTKRCSTVAEGLPTSCVMQKANCLMGAWSLWLPANCSGTAQKTRKRDIVTFPTGIGATKCNESTSETMPCSTRSAPSNCTVSIWSMWSACDKPCDGGYSYRSRAITAEAAHRGTCAGHVLKELKPCNERAVVPCVRDVDCTEGSWTSWSPLGSTQVSLNKLSTLIQPAKAQGKRCEGSVMEVKVAPPPPVVDCTFTDWMEWTSCTKECGMGQRSRSRSALPWSGTGKCTVASTGEVQGCNPQLCGRACAFSAWSLWSKCSADCGQGAKTRTRTVIQPGFDCKGELSEAAACSGVGAYCSMAATQDCVWGQWLAWSACSATCGGGSSERSRKVAVPAGKDGSACAALPMAELKSCNPWICDPCIDGVWKAWGEWSTCSTTCDSGVRARKRQVHVEANACGKPPTGKEGEYEVCRGGISHAFPMGVPCVANVNCKLGPWGNWSACQPACFGVSERSRAVATKASGNGLPCTESTKELMPCKPGKGEAIPAACVPKNIKDCVLSVWGDWSHCSADCSGTRQRLRRISQLPVRGKACENVNLNELDGCNTTSCKPTVCKDCKWSAWGKWGECTQCTGQRSRFRSVKQLPNYCGQACDNRNVEESRSCVGHCEGKKSCVWEEWTISRQCPTLDFGANCGPQTYTRTRRTKLVDKISVNQVAVAVGGRNTSCQGYETTTARCKNTVKCLKDCILTDCSFGAWSEWSGASCTGICERNRAIITTSKCGGKQCDGATVMSKVCSAAGCDQPVDCKLSAWTTWSPCPQVSDASTLGAQRTKQRAILVQPKYGGKLCHGPLRETSGCWEQTPQDCDWGAWAMWSGCTKSCGTSQKTRFRQYEVPVEFQGLPCEGDMREIAVCHVVACPFPANAMDCSWGAWTEWSCGKDSKYMASRSRARDAPSDPKLLKAPCVGESHQMKLCEEGYELPAWGNWSKCTKTCGGGQRTRTRQDMLAPAGGMQDDFPESRLPVTAPLSETVGCNDDVPCEPNMHKNCSLTTWTSWSACSSSCGPGQQERVRDAVNRHIYGKGCTDHMAETQACIGENPCPVVIDCAWGNWSAWTNCNKLCGGGEKMRIRDILTAPLNGGKKCSASSKEEVVPCNKQVCNPNHCIDGVWAQWALWTSCSLTCDPGEGFVGIKSRARGIAQFPNECGTPLEGASQQVTACKNAVPCPSIDCLLNAWQPWSGCGTGCDGYQKRHRTVQTPGSGPIGKQCAGAMEETIGCKPCEAIVPVNCQWSDWIIIGGVAAYNGCTVSCGGGRVVRKRHIAVNARNGGKACDGALQETHECGSQSCPTQVAIDCVWGSWIEWTACDTCGPTGQRTRSRAIATPPSNGGKDCGEEDSEQIKSCNVPCDQTYCTWQAWQPWGNCSASCGSGRKSRRRYLFSSTEPDLEQLTLPKQDDKQFASKYSELKAHIDSVNSSRWRDLSGAFLLGGIAFLVALSAIRLRSSVTSNSEAASYRPVSSRAWIDEEGLAASRQRDANCRSEQELRECME